MAARSKPDLPLLLKVRTAVAFLGERSQAKWWDSSFLNPVGFQYLALIYPKTVASAALNAACAAACRAHDERIGRGRIVHLFRLPTDVELSLQRELHDQSLTILTPKCVEDAAFAALEDAGRGAQTGDAAGPAQIGKFNDCCSSAAVARLAATYLAGFRAGKAVFPYFA